MIRAIRSGLSIYVGAIAYGLAALGARRLAAALRRGAVRLAPWRVRAWLRHALSLRLLGRRHQGLACLARAKRLLTEAAPIAESEGALPAAEDRAAERRALARARHWAAYARVANLYAKRAEARAAYLRALQLAPERDSLWTEFAELMRQIDDPAAEVAARRRAVEAGGGDAAERELARALAAAGREASAAETHPSMAPWPALDPEAALDADPPPLASAAAAPEPSDARTVAEARAAAAPAEIVVDLTDLVRFLQHNRVVSGIQRVQAELALKLLQRGGSDAASAPGARVRPALYDPGSGRWRLADPDAVIALIEGTRGRADVRGRRLRRLVERVEASLRDGLEALDRPVLFTPGAAWDDWRYHLSVRDAKRRCGLRYVPFVHDCIPLLLPETCPPNIPRLYGRWLAGAASLADAFLVNSERTGADLRRMLGQAIPDAPPIACVRLDGRTEFGVAPARPRFDARMARALSNRGFALVVGSIEPRKNHRMVFEAWSELVRRFGRRAPMLVVVGRSGWREEATLDALDAAEELQGSVVLLHDVADAELAWLYARARFSIVASLYEGWGMPVTESLNAGVPTLTARNSALVESGGDAVEYFDARDRADLLEKLEAFCFDDRALSAARTRAREAPLRDWSDLAAEVLDALARVARRPADPRRLAPELTPGARYDFGVRAFGRALAVQEGALHGKGWLGREPGALWTVGGAEARLAVRAAALETPGPSLAAALGAPVCALSLCADEAAVAVSAARVDAAGRRVDEQVVTLARGAVAELAMPVPAGLAPGGLFEIAIETNAPPGRRGVGVSAVRLGPPAETRTEAAPEAGEVAVEAASPAPRLAP